MNYPIDDILLFAKIAEYSTFKDAANELELASTTLSRRINALEDKIGEKLLITTREGFQLTPFGTELYKRLSHYNSEISNELTNLFSHKDNYLGSIDILLPAFVITMLSAKQIKHILDIQKNVRLNIHTFNGFELPHDAEKRYDLIVSEYLPDTSQFYIKKINTVKSKLYCSARYIENYGEPTTIDELIQHSQRIASIKPSLNITHLDSGDKYLITEAPAISGTVMNNLEFINSDHFIVESAQGKLILHQGNIAILPDYYAYEYTGYLLKNPSKQTNITDKIERELIQMLNTSLNKIKID